jgi:hypothetical protein
VARRHVPGGLARRGFDQISGSFDGMALLPPGVVPVADWDAEKPSETVDLVRAGILAGVARVR